MELLLQKMLKSESQKFGSVKDQKLENCTTDSEPRKWFPRLEEAQEDHDSITRTRMLSKLSEGKLLEARSVETLSLWLNESNVWHVFSSHEESRRKQILLFRKWELETEMNYAVLQSPMCLSRALHIVTTLRQGPSLLCPAYPQWTAPRASRPPPSAMCIYPQSKATFS